MDMTKIVAISLATAAVSILVTNAVATERLRAWVAMKTGRILDCPFCVSWWAAAPITLAVAPLDLDLLAYYLAGVGGSALVSSIVLRES